MLGAPGTCATVTGTPTLAPPTATVMVALPFATAVTIGRAPPLTEATEGADDVTVGAAPGMTVPFWSRTVTVNDSVAPTASKERLDTDAVIVVATSGGVESLPHPAPAPSRTSAVARTASRAAKHAESRETEERARGERFIRGAKVDDSGMIPSGPTPGK